MADKTVGRFNFKDNLTSLDYQKILIEQNQTIIQLLALQHDNLFHGALNQTIIGSYHQVMDKYTESAPIHGLSDTDRKRVEDLRRRKANGEDVTELAKYYNVLQYL